MQVKRSDIKELYEILSSCSPTKVRAKYAIARIKSHLSAEYNAIIKALDPPPAYKEYSTKLTELLRECAEFDAKGRSLFDQNGYDGIKIRADKKKHFWRAITELKEKYSETIEHYAKCKQESEIAFLSEEVEVSGIEWTIPIDHLEDNDLPQRAYDILVPMGIITAG